MSKTKQVIKEEVIKAWAIVNMGRIETIYQIRELLAIFKTKKDAENHKGYDEVQQIEIRLKK